MFINLHAVQNYKPIARLLLPLFQHVEQCEKSKVVGWQNAVLRPRTELEVTHGHRLFASSNSLTTQTNDMNNLRLQLYSSHWTRSNSAVIAKNIKLADHRETNQQPNWTDVYKTLYILALVCSGVSHRVLQTDVINLGLYHYGHNHDGHNHDGHNHDDHEVYHDGHSNENVKN